MNSNGVLQNAGAGSTALALEFNIYLQQAAAFSGPLTPAEDCASVTWLRCANASTIIVQRLEVRYSNASTISVQPLKVR